ncbi:MAG: TIGR00268 family protein, partial [Coriobacteriia bacterium]|nr:TIGR00268 family protein [Coriobacteriia bacterium]
FRVRSHSGLARIEVTEEDWQRFSDKGFRSQVEAVFRGLGFDFVAIDLSVFRSGSMDQALKGLDR